MVIMETTEPTGLFGQMEGMKKFRDGHLGLDLHRRRFGGGTRAFLQNVEKRSEVPPPQKVETSSSRSRDNVVWQRIKAFDS